MREATIIAVGTARMASTRCPGKMLKPFGGSTLAEIAVDRLNRLTGFSGVYFAAHEPELQEIAARYPNVALLERSKESATLSSPITKVHEYLLDLEFDYIFWINCCHAMLRPETIQAALDHFRTHEEIRSMTAVVKNTNWLYTLDGRPVNNLDPRVVDTRFSPALWEVCHAFHCYNKHHFFQTGTCWTNQLNDPALYEIDPIEAVDVDTELDFVVAQAVYASNHSEPLSQPNISARCGG